jgi:hypothetical protein
MVRGKKGTETNRRATEGVGVRTESSYSYEERDPIAEGREREYWADDLAAKSETNLNQMMKNNELTPNKIRDLGLKFFAKYARDKYDKGQSEHQGILTDRDHLDEIMAEAVDLFWYAFAAKLKRIMTMAELGLLSPKQLSEMLREIGIEEDDGE